MITLTLFTLGWTTSMPCIQIELLANHGTPTGDKTRMLHRSALLAFHPVDSDNILIRREDELVKIRIMYPHLTVYGDLTIKMNELSSYIPNQNIVTKMKDFINCMDFWEILKSKEVYIKQEDGLWDK